MTQSWCKRNKGSFKELSHCFDYNRLTAEEKVWVSSSLQGDESLVKNALYQSHLVSITETQLFNLDDSRLCWKRVFDSSMDGMGLFLEVAVRSLELFHKKLTHFHVYPPLSLALYVPKKITKEEEVTVDDQARVFAFPHTRDQASTCRRVVPTNKSYKMYCYDHLL